MKTIINKPLMFGAIIALTSVTNVCATTVNIANPSFENSWSGWTDTDPSAISSDSHAGNKAAKVTGASGAFEQSVSVQTNTNYVLTAYIKGSGKIGITINGETYSSTGGGSNYELVSVYFNSGDSTSATIVGGYANDEGRFDSFALETTDVVVDPETDPETTCTSSEQLAISTAFDNGTNDGHGPLNSIDNDTSDESRWSSKGSGKTITYDLGNEAAVTDLSIKWFKGNARSSYFDVDTSTDNNSWTSVLSSGQSNGSSSSYELHDVIDSNARYVRITGYGNSAGSTWNSIIETKVLGCGDTVIIDPDVEPETDLDFDMSNWDVEGYDPIVGNTMVFDALAAQHITPNGNGWRHELKIKSDLRVAMTEVYEDFRANITTNLSDGSKTIVAQHHASDTGTIMKLYVSDTSESGFEDSIAVNGVFDVYVRLAKEDGSGEEKKALGTIRSGDNFDFQVINDHGTVTVSAFGETFTLTIEDSSDSYLKFGNYLQAQDPVTREDVDSSDDFEQFYIDQNITSSVLTFKNISYVRDVD